MEAQVTVGPWKMMPPNTYRITAWLIPEPDDGGYSVVGINLPGLGTQGETLVEAMENLKDAARLLLASYLDDGGEIPWHHGPAQLPTVDARRLSVFVIVE